MRQETGEWERVLQLQPCWGFIGEVSSYDYQQPTTRATYVWAWLRGKRSAGSAYIKAYGAPKASVPFSSSRTHRTRHGTPHCNSHPYQRNMFKRRYLLAVLLLFFLLLCCNASKPIFKVIGRRFFIIRVLFSSDLCAPQRQVSMCENNPCGWLIYDPVTRRIIESRPNPSWV